MLVYEYSNAPKLVQREPIGVSAAQAYHARCNEGVVAAMTNVLEPYVRITGVSSAAVMRVPVGPAPPLGEQLAYVVVNEPYNYLYICTGILEFDWSPNNGWTTATLTAYGDQDPRRVPFYDASGDVLSLRSPRTGQPYAIVSRALTVGLAAIGNPDDDNGGWRVDDSSILDPDDTDFQVAPQMEIHISVRGGDGIHFFRVNYAAFFQVNTIT